MTDIPIVPPQDILPATRMISEEEWNEYQELKEWKQYQQLNEPEAVNTDETEADEVVSDFGYPGPKA